MESFSQFAMVAVEEAMTDSGIDLEKSINTRAGVIWVRDRRLRNTFQMKYCFRSGDGNAPNSTPSYSKMIADISADYFNQYGFSRSKPLSQSLPVSSATKKMRWSMHLLTSD